MRAGSLGDFHFRYTRAQALRDGLLLDITPAAREHAEIPVHTVLTLGLWRTLAGNAAFTADDPRVKDLCYGLLFAAVGLTPGRWSGQDTLRFGFKTGERQLEAKLVLGPGDDGELVATLMLLAED